MAELKYSAITSLDGYIEDQSGSFAWAQPDKQVHKFINDLLRPVGSYLYGRRMYEVMADWETDPGLAEQSPVMRDFGEIWRAADKVVYSRTLPTAITSNTRIERKFDPEAVLRMKRESARPLVIGGPELAAQAFKADLIDECHLFLAPIVIGQGKPALPTDVRLELDLLEERSFASGMVYLRYRTVLTQD